MVKLRSALVLFVCFLSVSIGAVLLLTFCALTLPWRPLRVRAANAYGKVVGRLCFIVGGIAVDKVDWDILDTSFPAIYVSNHTSTLDGPLAMWVCPYGAAGVSKKELARIPFFGWAYLLSGHLLIDRKNRASAIEAMSELAATVKKNRLGIWIWPEGTRSPDGRLGSFKKGFVHMALATGLPIVPIVATNAHRVWPKGTMLVRPVPMRIQVLPPVDTSNWTIDGVDDHVEEIWHLFADALPEDMKPAPGQEPVRRRPMKLAVNA